jgi:hypothetical protein
MVQSACLHLHSGTCGYDVSISGPVDWSGSREEGMDVVSISKGLTSGSGTEGAEGTEQIWSSPDRKRFSALVGLK